jgi:hypothetical protein
MSVLSVRPIVCGLVSLNCLLVAAAAAREFSDSSGRIKVNGEVVAFDGKTVRLSSELGESNLPLERFSAADIAYIKATFPNGKSPELLKSKPTWKKESAAPEAAAKGSSAKGAAANGERAAPAKDEKAGPSKVELVGLAVSKAVEKLPADASPLPAGTHLYLIVSNPELNLTGLDAEKSKIASCTDNKNTDLTGEQGSGSIEFQALADGKSALVHVHQPKCPAAKSVRLAVKGELHLTTGVTGDDSQTVRVPLNLDVNLGL